MNSAPEKEGRALLRAWRNASVSISIELISASHAPFVSRRGRITALDQKRIVLSTDNSEELAIDLTGAAFGEVASASRLRSLGLDSSRYSEMIEISLGNMDRLTLFAAHA